MDEYEEANPGTTISAEYSDWGGYWDKLATTIAARDAPDIIQMDLGVINEYMGRGALLPIPESVDTSRIEPSALEPGQTEDGLAGVPNGVNTYAIFANPAIFEKAGVPLPDDATWTWDDYERISKEITENTNGEA
nr:extracellular solute-binding protein [Arthrobacter sp. H5]